MRHRHVNILTLIRPPINENTERVRSYNSNMFPSLTAMFENFVVRSCRNSFVSVHTRDQKPHEKHLLDKLKIPRFCLSGRVLT